MKIFNIGQADKLIKNGATVVGCGLGNRFKVYIELLDNELLYSLIDKWIKKEL